MPTASDVVASLNQWAPEAQKADFDNVGLQIGDPARDISRVIIALDLTPEVIDEAVASGAEMIVTHHPLLFKPLKRIIPDAFVPALAFRLARENIAFAAIHTNLDAQFGGVSFALAGLLGLEDVTTLAPESGMLKKLVVFAPETHAQVVREAMAEAGAGQIGAYRDCSFSASGEGRFRATNDANPHVGARGDVHVEPEIRIEVLVERWRLGGVIRAMKTAHPYEEVAYDVFAVEQSSRTIGYGALGTLPEPLALADFLRVVTEGTGAEVLRYSASPEATISRVAVCGGSGMNFFGAALASGADAYVTGDITYHRFFDPLDARGHSRLALIDAGHYETEWVTEQLLAEYLTGAFPDLTVSRTQHRTSPVQTFVP